MKERPIIFNGSMVAEILEGRKTQTRRVIKTQPASEIINAGCWLDGSWRIEYKPAQTPIGEYVGLRLRCPYGVPGDRLWVKETWGVGIQFDACKPSDILAQMKPGKCPQITYKASSPNFYRWRPSIFMPRWASRITLKVIDVRAERVQDITPADCVAEGIEQAVCLLVNPSTPERIKEAAELIARNRFRELWNSINAKRGFGWDVNPWVWVIEFRVYKPD